MGLIEKARKSMRPNMKRGVSRRKKVQQGEERAGGEGLVGVAENRRR